MPRGEALRGLAALSARPRVRDGSREGGGGKGAVFDAIRRGSGGGLVPVESEGGPDGEVEWPRPSEDKSRGTIGRTGEGVCQHGYFSRPSQHLKSSTHAFRRQSSKPGQVKYNPRAQHTHLVTASQPGAFIVVTRSSAYFFGAIVSGQVVGRDAESRIGIEQMKSGQRAVGRRYGGSEDRAQQKCRNMRDEALRRTGVPGGVETAGPGQGWVGLG